jgi:hypothetical protein
MDHQAFAQLLGNYGEFVGAIAVVLTLVYLVAQIQHSTRATRAASHHAITDSLNLGNIAQAQDAELAQIFLSGCEDRTTLSDVERQRFDMLMLSYFHALDSLFYSANIGTGEQDLLKAEEPGIASLINSPGVGDWWEANPYGFSVSFRNYVEGLRHG